MKLGFTTFACPQWDFEEIIAAARRHRYHGVEFRTDAGHQHGIVVTTKPSVRLEIRQRLVESGIEACCLATSLRLLDDEFLNQLPAYTELAADTGCPGVRVLGGRITEDMTVAHVIEKASWPLREAADIAAEAGVELWLETSDLFTKAADAAAVVRAANHAAVGICYNNIHPYRHGESLRKTTAALKGLVRHTHFHDAVNSPDQVIITPAGRGEMPIHEMFQALTQMEFDGYLSGEWFHDQYGNNPDDSLEAYHRDMTSLAQRHHATLSGV